MKMLRSVLLVSLVGLSAGGVFAQAGGGKGPGTGPGPMGAGPAASAPGMGMGPMGAGQRGAGQMGGRGAARWGSDYTPGWQLMTQQERNEHRDRMRAIKSYEECTTYRTQHHELMAARAKEKSGKTLPQPRRDGCAALKP